MKLTISRDNTSTLEVHTFHEDGSPVNLIGCNLLMCAKADQALPNSQSTFQKSTGGNGINIVDQINGVFRVSISTADTQGFPDTTFLYLDFLVTDPLGEAFTISPDTTLIVRANYSRK